MTFAPAQNRAAGSSPITRTLIFWIMMMALAVFLWRMANNSPAPSTARTMSYSDFMGEVAQSNIASAKLLEGRSTAQVQGQLRQPAQNFTVTIPDEVISDLMPRLEKQGTAVEVREAAVANPATATALAMNFGPLVIIAIIAFFIFRLRRNQQNRSQQGTASSGPLG